MPADIELRVLASKASREVSRGKSNFVSTRRENGSV